MQRSILVLLSALLLVACDRSPQPGIDTIFVNARAWTLDASAPRAEAIAVNGNTIVYVGDTAGAITMAGESTVRHDLDGQVLLPGFSYYKRDENGDATGYLLEGTAGMAMSGLNVITEDVIVAETAQVVDVLNSYGVTSVFDAGAIEYEESLQRVLQRLESGGDLTVRIVATYRPSGPDDVEMALSRAIEWRDNIKGDRYHYRMLKIMDDGTVEGRTAAMFEDYQGEPGNSGETVYTEEQMTEMVVGAAGEQIDVYLHALGERAVHEALNSIEAAGLHIRRAARAMRFATSRSLRISSAICGVLTVSMNWA